MAKGDKKTNVSFCEIAHTCGFQSDLCYQFTSILFLYICVLPACMIVVYLVPMEVR